MKTPYEIVFQNITDKLAQGVTPWVKPWTGQKVEWAINAETGKQYQGSNAGLLYVAQLCGHGSNKYATYKQWQALGRQVKKGETSTPIVYYAQVKGKTDADTGDTKKGFSFIKYYSVFNESQLADYEQLTTKTIDFIPIDQAKKIVIDSPSFPFCKIVHDKQSAFYNPLLDYINMPKPETFNSAQNYYATLFHEMGHSTGHETRLNRDLSNQFGDHKYSKEELVAELVSAFLCNESGIESTIEQSASYCASWLKKFTDQPKEMLTAFSQAVKACDYILNVKREAFEAKSEAVAVAD